MTTSVEPQNRSSAPLKKTPRFGHQGAVGNVDPIDTPNASPTVYGSVFWLCYLANTSTMVAITLLVRYADFVKHLGGDEAQLGLIVGVGMFGCLAMRLFLGVGIDRYGPRRIWLLSLLGFIISTALHALVTTAFGPAIFLLRLAMWTSIAGIFGSSVTYISRRVPPARMAEMIGALGSSGFLGMLIGPQIGDWICGGEPIERYQLNLLFFVAAAMGALALAAVFAATLGEPAPVVRRRAPAWGLLRRYFPGVVVLAAIATGAGVSLPQTFLRPYAAHLNISTVGLFFAGYAVIAFIVRISTSKLPERFGVRPMILTGLACLAISMLLYLPVRHTPHLLLPALGAGVAHAFLFPSIMAGGSMAFPSRHRGLATTLMMGMCDIGVLVGAPLTGLLLVGARAMGLPEYPTMYVCMCAAIFGVALIYFIFSRPAGAKTIKR